MKHYVIISSMVFGLMACGQKNSYETSDVRGQSADNSKEISLEEELALDEEFGVAAKSTKVVRSGKQKLLQRCKSIVSFMAKNQVKYSKTLGCKEVKTGELVFDGVKVPLVEIQSKNNTKKEISQCLKSIGYDSRKAISFANAGCFQLERDKGLSAFEKKAAKQARVKHDRIQAILYPND